MTDNELLSTKAKCTNNSVLVAIAAVCLVLAVFQILYSDFDTDEFQHTHIAWLSTNGEVLYKDFFEHHGPLYPLLNSSVIKVLNLERDTETFFSLRFVNLFILVANLIALFYLSLSLLGTKTAALLSCAFFASSSVFIGKGTEIRPDTIQSLFWLLGTLFFVRYLESFKSKKALFISGLMYGLSILSNAKAAYGVCLAFIFLILVLFYFRSRFSKVCVHLLVLLAGILIPIGATCLYFYRQGALSDFIYFNTVHNYNLFGGVKFRVDSENVSLAERQFVSFLFSHIAFIFFYVIGLVLIISNLFKNTLSGVNKNLSLLLLLALGTSLIIIVNVYIQNYLIFLPLWAMVSSFAFLRVGSFIPLNHRGGVFLVLLLLCFLPRIWSSIAIAPFSETALLRRQLSRTDFVIQETIFEEPVGYLWSNCSGGNVFNANMIYCWIYWPGCKKTQKNIEADDDGEFFVEVLEEKKIKHIVTSKQRLRTLSRKANGYISENYSYKDCLFTRKTP